MTMKWIDVHDSVPDNRRLVLVYGYRGLRIQPKYGVGFDFALSKFNPSAKDGGAFDIEQRTKFSLLFYVTHWCELEAPQEAVA